MKGGLLPPAPPPSDPPPLQEGDLQPGALQEGGLQHDYFKKKVIYYGEAKGPSYYGQVGVVTELHGPSLGRICFDSTISPWILSLELCELYGSFKPKLALKGLNSLSRPVKRTFCELSGNLFQPPDLGASGIENIPDFPKDEMLYDVHLQAGISFLVHEFQPEKVVILPPDFCMSLTLGLVGGASTSTHDDLLKRVVVGSSKFVMPIWGNQPPHWTLLAVDFHDDAVQVVRYYDTLSKMNAACLQVAQHILQVLGYTAAISSTTNLQKQAGATCGLWVLVYLERELRASRGEGWSAAQWPQDAFKTWQSRLKGLVKALQDELLKVRVERVKNRTALEAQQQRLLKKTSAENFKALHDNILKSAEESAMKAAEHDPIYDKIPSEMKERLERLKKMSLGVCSKCRWSHGCLECDYTKARRYALRKLLEKEALDAAAASKKPIASLSSSSSSASSSS
jgi:hypothetical protein